MTKRDQAELRDIVEGLKVLAHRLRKLGQADFADTLDDVTSGVAAELGR